MSIKSQIDLIIPAICNYTTPRNRTGSSDVVFDCSLYAGHNKVLINRHKSFASIPRVKGDYLAVENSLKNTITVFIRELYDVKDREINPNEIEGRTCFTQINKVEILGVDVSDNKDLLSLFDYINRYVVPYGIHHNNFLLNIHQVSNNLSY